MGEINLILGHVNKPKFLRKKMLDGGVKFLGAFWNVNGGKVFCVYVQNWFIWGKVQVGFK